MAADTCRPNVKRYRISINLYKADNFRQYSNVFMIQSNKERVFKVS